ncbi:MAG: plasmid pRiA4b ORF-3 family protein [bacterium]
MGDEPPNSYARVKRRYTEEKKVKLKEYLTQKGDFIKYIYDFGDDWEHKIEVIDILKKEDNREYPVCVEGENASPPEDVGGISAYKRMIQAFSKKNHPDYEMYKEWLGIEVYDAEKFDIDLVNKKLINKKLKQRD